MATLCLCVAMYSAGRRMVTQQSDHTTPAFATIAVTVLPHAVIEHHNRRAAEGNGHPGRLVNLGLGEAHLAGLADVVARARVALRHNREGDGDGLLGAGVEGARSAGRSHELLELLARRRGAPLARLKNYLKTTALGCHPQAMLLGGAMAHGCGTPKRKFGGGTQRR
jgi:hypothetical protein